VDKVTEQLIVEILKELVSEGKTVFVVHHDLNTVNNYFDQVIMLNTRLIACGGVEETFIIDNLQKTFGQLGPLFEETLHLTSRTQKGFE